MFTERICASGSRVLYTTLTTLGWLILVLYWIGFAWSRHTLLQNGAVLMVSFLVWQGIVVVFWLAGPSDERL